MSNAARSLGVRLMPKRLPMGIDFLSGVRGTPQSTSKTASCAEAIFAASEHKARAEIDRLFAVLMLLQWVAAIAIAFVISPRTWIGDEARVHVHIWAAVLLGGVLSGFPILLAQIMPGATLTRHVIAVAQMLWSAL